jgi:hypothetical protein
MGAADRATINDPTTPSVWVSAIPPVAAAAQPAEPLSQGVRGTWRLKLRRPRGTVSFSDQPVAAKRRRRSVTVISNAATDADPPVRSAHLTTCST